MSKNTKKGDAGEGNNSTSHCSCGGNLTTKAVPRDAHFPNGQVGYYVITCEKCGATRTIYA